MPFLGEPTGLGVSAWWCARDVREGDAGAGLVYALLGEVGSEPKLGERSGVRAGGGGGLRLQRTAAS